MEDLSCSTSSSPQRQSSGAPATWNNHRRPSNPLLAITDGSPSNPRDEERRNPFLPLELERVTLYQNGMACLERRGTQTTSSNNPMDASAATSPTGTTKSSSSTTTFQMHIPRDQQELILSSLSWTTPHHPECSVQVTWDSLDTTTTATTTTTSATLPNTAPSAPCTTPIASPRNIMTNNHTVVTTPQPQCTPEPPHDHHHHPQQHPSKLPPFHLGFNTDLGDFLNACLGARVSIHRRLQEDDDEDDHIVGMLLLVETEPQVLGTNTTFTHNSDNDDRMQAVQEGDNEEDVDEDGLVEEHEILAAGNDTTTTRYPTRQPPPPPTAATVDRNVAVHVLCDKKGYHYNVGDIKCVDMNQIMGIRLLDKDVQARLVDSLQTRLLQHTTTTTTPAEDVSNKNKADAPKIYPLDQYLPVVFHVGASDDRALLNVTHMCRNDVVPPWSVHYRLHYNGGSSTTMNVTSASSTVTLHMLAQVSNASPVEDWNEVELSLVAESSMEEDDDGVGNATTPRTPLYVKTWAGQCITVHVLPTDTLATVQQHIDQQLGIPTAQQQLFFAGCPLCNNHDDDDDDPTTTLQDYHIPLGSILQLQLLARGTPSSSDSNVLVASNDDHSSSSCITYTSQHPVSLAAGQSGLVTLAQLELPAVRVLVFDPNRSNTSTFQGLHITNTSSQVLCAGPLSLVVAGTTGGTMGRSPSHQWPPLYPNEDVVVPLRPDPTVRVTVRHPKDQQLPPQVLSVQDVNGSIRVTEKRVRVSRYIVVGSPSFHKDHKKLYIDHSASCDHGGYAITTTDHSIYAVTGFSRFCLTDLKPQKEVVLDVVEEAFPQTTYSTPHELQEWLKTSAKTLVEQGLVSNQVQQKVQKRVAKGIVREFLEAILQDDQARDRELPSGLPESLKQLFRGNSSAYCVEVLVELLSTLSSDCENLQRWQQDIAAKEDELVRSNERQDRLLKQVQAMEQQKSSKLVSRCLDEMDANDNHIRKVSSKIKSLQQDVSDVQMDLQSTDNKLKEVCSTMLAAIDQM